MDNEQKRDPHDLNEDYFPTSARPVFITAGILALCVALLCISAAFCSDEEERGKRLTKAPESSSKETKKAPLYTEEEIITEPIWSKKKE